MLDHVEDEDRRRALQHRHLLEGTVGGAAGEQRGGRAEVGEQRLPQAELREVGRAHLVRVRGRVRDRVTGRVRDRVRVRDRLGVRLRLRCRGSGGGGVGVRVCFALMSRWIARRSVCM